MHVHEYFLQRAKIVCKSKKCPLPNGFTVITCKQKHFEKGHDESFSYKSVKVKVGYDLWSILSMRDTFFRKIWLAIENGKRTVAFYVVCFVSIHYSQSKCAVVS